MAPESENEYAGSTDTLGVRAIPEWSRNKGVKFFYPYETDSFQAECRYRMLCTQLSVPLSNKRIQQIRYRCKNRTIVATVGEQPDRLHRSPLGERILAILPGSPLMICTPTRGIGPRAPIYVGALAIIEMQHFDELPHYGRKRDARSFFAL